MNVTEQVAREVLTLPLHSLMRPEFVNRVIEGVQSFFR
jgi:dTDP-4-amino-4,6-dideoxygalactose transaminase